MSYLYYNNTVYYCIEIGEAIALCYSEIVCQRLWDLLPLWMVILGKYQVQLFYVIHSTKIKMFLMYYIIYPSFSQFFKIYRHIKIQYYGKNKYKTRSFSSSFLKIQ